MNSVTKKFSSGRGGKRIPGPGKKIGRPKGEKTKVIRLPADIADKIKENPDIIDTIFHNSNNGSDSCNEKLKEVGFDDTKQTNFDSCYENQNSLSEIVKNGSDSCNKNQKEVGFDDTTSFDSCYKKLNGLSEIVKKWNDIIDKSENPNQPRLKKVNELLAELNEVLKKEMP